MNKKECDQLIEVYVSWLRKGFSAENMQEGCELTTPFLDRHNDHLQIYAIKQDGKIIISDDGYILSDLRTSGLELSTEKRKGVLESVLNGFGVRIKEGQLLVEASQQNFGQRLHSLVQAMLTVNDMFVMAQPRVASTGQCPSNRRLCSFFRYLRGLGRCPGQSSRGTRKCPAQ